MIEIIQEYFSEKYLETIATILGLINIYFGIKEKAFFWVLSVIGSGIYVFVYADAKVYAFMALQIYYIVVGTIGLFYWLKGSNKNKKKIKVTKLPKKIYSIYGGVFVLVFVSISIILNKFTDSEIPYIDAFISAGSVIAIYLMMKKRIETWYVWITLDLVTIITFIKQELYITVVLFLFYLIFAVVGYFEWKKSMLKTVE